MASLLTLLSAAGDQYRTARATVRHVLNGALASEADRRFEEYARRRGMTFSLGASDARTVASEDNTSQYEAYEELDELVRIWHEPPRRWRQETFPRAVLPLVRRDNDPCGISADPRVAYHVEDGEGRWWVYDRTRGIKDFEEGFAGYPEVRRHPPELAYMLDPNIIYDTVEGETEPQIEATGTRLGRETVEVLLKTISWDYPPWTPPFVAGADHHELSVDARTGAILRFAAWMDGHELYAAEAEEVVFNEQFSEGTFRLDPALVGT